MTTYYNATLTAASDSRSEISNCGETCSISLRDLLQEGGTEDLVLSLRVGNTFGESEAVTLSGELDWG